LASENKVLVSYPASHQGWPRVEGGIEVTIEVRSDVMESERSTPPVGCLCL
jgi:hypothetical protein